MIVTRRRFFSSASACAGGMFLGRLAEFGTGHWRTEKACVVLDLGEQCALRESLQGYRSVVGDRCLFVLHETQDWGRGCQLVIVPGVAMLGEQRLSALLRAARAGATVLVESGAGFLEGHDFLAHQKTLRQMLDVVICRPVDVWAEGESIPYIYYSWPAERTVRDFSRVVPVLADDLQVIGRMRGLSVAARRRVGKGQVIYLGSPLGPALCAGDVEARQWLEALRLAI